MKQKVTSNPDKSPEPSPAEKTSHRRQVSKDSLTSINMSYISRQRIDPKTEQELRAACALILQNFKPSDHDIPDADPKLDFRGPHTRRREVLTVKVSRPSGAPADYKATHVVRSDTQRAASSSKSYPDLPMRANTGKRRVESTEHAEREADIRRSTKSSTNDAPRQHFVRVDSGDTDDVLSVGTPLTTSTDAHHYSYSTAPTSVAATHRSSKRASRHGDGPAAIADAQAAEWMRQELEKRRHQMASNPHQSRPQTSERPPSRATSIRSGIREYIFPGSRSLSRTQSRSSLRSEASQEQSNGSERGWRSWGLNRRSSSRRSSRPGTSNGRKEYGEQDKKSELNLNRELPPLPSLDTWKEPKKEKQPKTKVPAAGPHIATMMRPVDQQQQSYAAAARQHHRRSGSDTLATRYVNAYETTSPRIRSPVQQAFAQKSAPRLPEDRTLDFDHMVSAMSAGLDADDHALRRSSIPPGSSADGHLAAPNFSRKISTDGVQADHHFDATEYAYPNAVQITAAQAKKAEPEQKSKLKKVFSSWVLKKEKKGEGDWMQRFEKEGIKTGVMTQDQAALPPIVRY